MPAIIEDPEKGTQDNFETVALEKRPITIETKGLLPPVEPRALVPGAGKKAQRKVSRWVRFQLWFNTYRCVVATCT